MMFPDHDRGATISPCGQYRYRLWRRVSRTPRTVLWIMLNPSTADAAQDDPTIRRLIGYAKTWGYGRLEVVNLYAGRATKPADLWLMDDPTGPENDRHIAKAAARADLIVCGWGVNADGRDRAAQVLALLHHHHLHALAHAKGGQPRHPLYLRSTLTPQPWSGQP